MKLGSCPISKSPSQGSSDVTPRTIVGFQGKRSNSVSLDNLVLSPAAKRSGQVSGGESTPHLLVESNRGGASGQDDLTKAFIVRDDTKIRYGRADDGVIPPYELVCSGTIACDEIKKQEATPIEPAQVGTDISKSKAQRLAVIMDYDRTMAGVRKESGKTEAPLKTQLAMASLASSPGARALALSGRAPEDLRERMSVATDEKLSDADVLSFGNALPPFYKEVGAQVMLDISPLQIGGNHGQLLTGIDATNEFGTVYQKRDLTIYEPAMERFSQQLDKLVAKTLKDLRSKAKIDMKSAADKVKSCKQALEDFEEKSSGSDDVKQKKLKQQLEEAEVAYQKAESNYSRLCSEEPYPAIKRERKGIIQYVSLRDVPLAYEQDCNVFLEAVRKLADKAVPGMGDTIGTLDGRPGSKEIFPPLKYPLETNKGGAVLHFMCSEFGPDWPETTAVVFSGDGENDESAHQAIRLYVNWWREQNPGKEVVPSYTIHVGEKKTHAEYCIAGVKDVEDMLVNLAKTWSSRGSPREK